MSDTQEWHTLEEWSRITPQKQYERIADLERENASLRDDLADAHENNLILHDTTIDLTNQLIELREVLDELVDPQERDKTPIQIPSIVRKKIRNLKRRVLTRTKERDEAIAEAEELLCQWVRWADMGIEDFLPDWVKPVLNETYEKTKEAIQ